MQVIDFDIKNESYFKEGCVVALGNFDGVHLGHRQLITTASITAKQMNLKSVVWSFADHPENVLAKSTVTPLITTNEIKGEILEELNIDYFFKSPFNCEIAALSPGDFVKRVLIQCLNAKVVVCGFHYHFAFRGEGDAHALLELCKENDIHTVIVPPVTKDNLVISSSHIRTLISAGRVAESGELLGKAFCVRADIIYGKQLGSQLGFPTINQNFPKNHIVPLFGVYITETVIDGHTFPSVTNVGYRPTVNGKASDINIETHILQFEKNIYGKTADVRFLKWLRNEMKFSSVLELKAQVDIDIKEARSFFKI